MSVPIGYNGFEGEVTLTLREERIRRTQDVAALTTMFYATYAVRQNVIIPRQLAREAVEVAVAKQAARRGSGSFLSRAKWLVRGGSKALGWLAIADGIVLLGTYGYNVFVDDQFQPTTLTGEAFDLLFGEEVAEYARDQITEIMQGDIPENAALASIIAFYLKSVQIDGRVELDGYSIGKIFGMSLLGSFEDGILDIELTDMIMYIIGACVAHIVIREWIKMFKQSTT